jgi:hypothetical protein
MRTEKVFAILNLLVSIFTVIQLTACGHSGGNLVLSVSGDPSASAQLPGQVSQAKNLFSTWTDSSNAFQIDMRQCAFGQTKTVSVAVVTGQTCTCQVLVQGTNDSGNMTFSSCSSSDCSSFAGAATYTNSASGLKVCNSSSCLNLK